MSQQNVGNVQRGATGPQEGSASPRPTSIANNGNQIVDLDEAVTMFLRDDPILETGIDSATTPGAGRQPHKLRFAQNQINNNQNDGQTVITEAQAEDIALISPHYRLQGTGIAPM